MTTKMHCSSKILSASVSPSLCGVLCNPPDDLSVDEGAIDLGQVVQQPLDVGGRGRGGRHVGAGGMVT